MRIMSVLFLCLVFFCSTGIVRAQESTPSAQILPAPNTPINLSLSPVSLALETEAGVPVQSELKIRNNSTSSEQLQISIGTFEADSTGENPVLRDPRPTDEFIKWLQVRDTVFTINPGEWKSIPFTFSPPATASLSYYYTIVVSRTSEAKPQSGETVLSGAPALLVLATVDSPYAKRQLEVSSFRALTPVAEYLPEEFEVVIKNTGNVHLAPSGNIFVAGLGKKDLAVLSLNPTIGMILPGTSRTYIVRFVDGFPVYESKKENDKDVLDAGGKPQKKLTWDFSKVDRFRIGKFTAHLLMVYDNGERDVPIESTVSFWVLPWKLLLLAIVLVVLVLFGLYSMISSIVRLFRKPPVVS
jgi:hypothetical protein